MNLSKSGITKMVLLASILYSFFDKIDRSCRPRCTRKFVDLLPKKVNIILSCVIFLLISIIDDCPLLYIFFITIHCYTFVVFQFSTNIFNIIILNYLFQVQMLHLSPKKKKNQIKCTIRWFLSLLTIVLIPFYKL